MSKNVTGRSSRSKSKLVEDFYRYLAGGAEFVYLGMEQDPWLDPIGREYFLNRERSYYLPKDEDGVPVVVYDPGGRHRYSPSRVASYGLANWNRYRQRGDARCRGDFLRCAEWFMRFEDGRFDYRYSLLGMRAPWISGLAQGEGISLLVRAFLLTEEERFLDQARKAFLPMTEGLNEGGVRNTLHDGSLFIEEYPEERPSHILNGFLIAAFGASDLHRVSPEDRTEEILDSCWSTLSRNIESWDLNGWSAYDLHNLNGSGPRNYCTASYQSLHVASLRYAHDLSRQPILRDFAERWEAALNSLPSRLRGMAGKVHYRLRCPNRV